MIKEYRKKTTIKAEQYQGTFDQQRRYGILRMQKSLLETPQDYLFPSINGNRMTVVKQGDWITTETVNEYQIILDDIFRRTYEEVKHE